MGGVLGRHAMLHRRPEVDVEYGEEEQAVDDQGDEDESHEIFGRLSRGDHMITYRARHACITFMYNLQGLVYIQKHMHEAQASYYCIHTKSQHIALTYLVVA